MYPKYTEFAHHFSLRAIPLKMVGRGGLEKNSTPPLWGSDPPPLFRNREPPSPPIFFQCPLSPPVQMEYPLLPSTKVKKIY